jgi:hypothetical protein
MTDAVAPGTPAVTGHDACEAYGLHLTGIGGVGLPAASGASLPRVGFRQAPGDETPGGRAPARGAAARVGMQRARLGLPDGRELSLRRRGGTATFTGPPLSHDELVHPYLGAAASVFSRWAGREVFHAGAFVCAGLAWAVVGGRAAGKSSLLAALAARGVMVLTDDLVVTDGHQAFCGPRAIDLRRPLPGCTQVLAPARGSSRWRLSLPPAPGAVPLGGWIYLTWRTKVAMDPVPASVSLCRLAARRSWPALPSAAETLLALAVRPGWDLGRPADFSRMDEVVDLILRTVTRPAGNRLVPAPESRAARRGSDRRGTGQRLTPLRPV